MLVDASGFNGTTVTETASAQGPNNKPCFVIWPEEDCTFCMCVIEMSGKSPSSATKFLVCVELNPGPFTTDNGKHHL